MSRASTNRARVSHDPHHVAKREGEGSLRDLPIPPCRAVLTIAVDTGRFLSEKSAINANTRILGRRERQHANAIYPRLKYDDAAVDATTGALACNRDYEDGDARQEVNCPIVVIKMKFYITLFGERDVTYLSEFKLNSRTHIPELTR